MKTKRNPGELKKIVIALAKSRASITSDDVAEHCSIPQNQAATHLKLYADKEDLLRIRGPRNSFIYYHPDNAPKSEQAAQPPVEQATEAAPVIPEDAQDEPAQVAANPLDQAIEHLVSAIMDTVMARVGPAIESKIADRIEQIAANLSPKESKEAKQHLPKVLIAGLLPSQASMIEKEFKQCFDISFVDANSTTNLLKSRAANAQHTLVMADFISHRHTDAIKSVGASPVIIRGGMSTLRNSLTELYVH